jgi:hypothetical protein
MGFAYYSLKVEKGKGQTEGGTAPGARGEGTRVHAHWAGDERVNELGGRTCQ